MNRRLEETPETLAEQAADWIVRLSADEAGERRAAESGFAAWKQADPRHAAAAARLEALLGRLDHIRDNGSQAPARQALRAARPRRTPRRIGAALALGAALLLPAWLALHSAPAPVLLADLRTGSGEWAERTLADGSRLSLNGNSAVDLEFDAKTRTIALLRGEILVDVAPDRDRPFVVSTAHGSIRALGTRFLVSREADATVLSMIESRVEVSIDGQPRPLVVGAGQRLRFTSGDAGELATVDGELLETAWQRHQLVVRNEPLGSVLDQLARHRPGLLRHDAAALAGLHVSAVLPLDDTDRALQLLINNFPGLRIRTLTPYLVVVDHPKTR